MGENENKNEVAPKSALPERSKVLLTPKQVESRKRAHEIKIAKFLAGGEF